MRKCPQSCSDRLRRFSFRGGAHDERRVEQDLAWRQARRAEALDEGPYPDGKTLLCHISLVGGRAFADLRDELRLSWDEMNARAETDERIARCIRRIVDDLADGIDLGGAATLVGVGNALTRNPALRRAVERRFGIPCAIPAVSEMAAYGAAIASRRKSDMMALNRSSGSLSV